MFDGGIHEKKYSVHYGNWSHQRGQKSTRTTRLILSVYFNDFAINEGSYAIGSNSYFDLECLHKYFMTKLILSL